MQTWVLIAGGGAAGALSRHWLTLWVQRMAGDGFPLGTLVVNVLGCLMAGAVYGWLQRSADGAGNEFLLVGFMGAFTTFSAFSLATLQLVERGSHVLALFNVLASVVLCLVACWAGLWAVTR